MVNDSSKMGLCTHALAGCCVNSHKKETPRSKYAIYSDHCKKAGSLRFESS